MEDKITPWQNDPMLPDFLDDYYPSENNKNVDSLRDNNFLQNQKMKFHMISTSKTPKGEIHTISQRKKRKQQKCVTPEEKDLFYFPSLKKIPFKERQNGNYDFQNRLKQTNFSNNSLKFRSQNLSTKSVTPKSQKFVQLKTQVYDTESLSRLQTQSYNLKLIDNSTQTTLKQSSTNFSKALKYKLQFLKLRMKEVSWKQIYIIHQVQYENDEKYQLMNQFKCLNLNKENYFNLLKHLQKYSTTEKSIDGSNPINYLLHLKSSIKRK